MRDVYYNRHKQHYAVNLKHEIENKFQEERNFYQEYNQQKLIPIKKIKRQQFLPADGYGTMSGSNTD